MMMIPVEVPIGMSMMLSHVEETDLFKNRFNIMALSSDPTDCAQWMCDKDIERAGGDYARILCAARKRLDWIEDYPDARPVGCPSIPDRLQKHPSVLWAKDCLMNYMWLLENWRETLREYKYRVGRNHPSEKLDSLVCADISQGIRGLSTKTTVAAAPPQCLPEVYRVPCNTINFRRWDNATVAYQNYYIHERYLSAKWTKRKPPAWFTTGVGQWDAEIFVNTKFPSLDDVKFDEMDD